MAAAAATAQVSGALIGIAESGSIDKSSLFAWWAPQFVGLFLFRNPWKGAFASLLLVLSIGTGATWRQRYEHKHTPPNPVFTLHLQPEQPSEPSFTSSGSNDPVTSLFAGIVVGVANTFEPRNYANAVINRNAPNAPWEMIEEQREAEEEERGQEGRSRPAWMQAVGDKLGLWVRVAAGCPAEAMPQADAQEAQDVLFWMNPIGARWVVYDAYHGAFCREVDRGGRSGLLQSWILLLFFALGVGTVSGQAGKPFPVNWSYAYGTLLRTVVFSAALVAAAGWTKFLRSTPAIESFKADAAGAEHSELSASMEPVRMPWSTTEITLSWKALRAKSYRLSVNPERAGIEGLTEKGTTASSVTVTIPKNLTLAPQEYSFKLEAARGERKTHSYALVEVEPSQANPMLTTDLGETLPSDIRAIVTDSRFVYITGTEGKPPSGKQTAAFDAQTYVAKLTPELKVKWKKFALRKDTPPDTGQLTAHMESSGSSDLVAMAVDSTGNIYTGGREAEPPTGPFQEVRQDAVVLKWDGGGSALGRTVVALNGEVKAIALDRDGNLLVVGYVGGASTDQINTVDGDAFVAKIDGKNGAILWMRQFGSRENDQATAIAVDEAGAAYVVGWTTAKPAWYHLTSEDGDRAFLAKFGGDGTPLWAKLFASIKGGPSITRASDGTLLISGNGPKGAFLGRCNNDGSMLWLKSTHMAGALAFFHGHVLTAANNLFGSFDDDGQQTVYLPYALPENNVWPFANGIAIFDDKLLVAGVRHTVPSFGNLEGDSRPFIVKLRIPR